MKILQITICCVLSWLSLPFIATSQDESEFRASFTRVNITPAEPKILYGYDYRRSDGVLDSIYHRIVILDDGDSRFVLVSSEICEYSPSLYDTLSGLISARFGIEKDHFWWVPTHTHSAPEVGSPGLESVFFPDEESHRYDREYLELIISRMLDGIKKGIEDLEPARIGYGTGFSMANINRRAIYPDGSVSLGMNPEGSVDRQIGIIRIEKADGTPFGLIANYPIHGTVLSGANTLISGDAPGVSTRYVEKKLGICMVFANGAMGNIAPIYSIYDDPESGHLEQFKLLLGEKVIEGFRSVNTGNKSASFRVHSFLFESERKEGLNWPEELSAYSRIDALGNKLVQQPIRMLIINNELAVWSAPVELFCEISNQVREASPYPYTFYYGLNGGFLGYLLSEDEYKIGGYERDCTPYTPDAGNQLIREVLQFLHAETRSYSKTD